MTSNDWKKVKLGEVLRLDLDLVPVESGKAYPMVGVYSFGRGLFAREPVDGSFSSYRIFYRLNSEHFVMSQLFGWEGALALSSEEFAGSFVSPQFPTFLCESNLNRYFLGWYARQPCFWDELKKRTRGMGDRRRTLNPDALFECEIPLPPRQEQDRIVTKLDALADKVDEVHENKLEIRQEADAMLHSAYARIIDGAPFRRMGEVAPLVRRCVEIIMDKEYYQLGIRSFGKGTFHKPALDYLSVGTKRLYRIEPGDLIFSNVFAWEGAIAVSQPEDEGRFGSHRFITCVPNQEVVTAEFLRFYFLTEEGLRKIGEASPGGAGRNRTLGLAKLAKIEVPVPDYEKQIWFNCIQAKVRELLASQKETEIELNAIIPSILDKTFNGELSL